MNKKKIFGWILFGIGLVLALAGLWFGLDNRAGLSGLILPGASMLAGANILIAGINIVNKS
jgi:hypothetical protein